MKTKNILLNSKKLPYQLSMMLMLFITMNLFAEINSWRLLEPGLEYIEFISPQKASLGDSKIRILRINLDFFNLTLLNASSEKNGKRKTVKSWSEQYDLVAAINASMYQADFSSSVSFMKNKYHVNNSRLSKDKTIFAFGPLVSDTPSVKLIDVECDDFDFWKNKFHTLIQSIRMVSCNNKNVWAPQKKLGVQPLLVSIRIIMSYLFMCNLIIAPMI